MTLRLVWNRGGAGEPLLLVHGIGTTHADFATLRPGLEAHYDVPAVVGCWSARGGAHT